jgi:hypothetical protein
VQQHLAVLIRHSPEEQLMHDQGVKEGEGQLSARKTCLRGVVRGSLRAQ